jgi:hypothetical protein
MKLTRQMTPQYLLRRGKACVLVAMQQHGNEQRAPLASGKIHEARPRQQFGEPLAGRSRKRSGIDSKTAQFGAVIISSGIPFMDWRATALAFAVSGHQLVHIAPISLESLALPTGASLSRTNPSLNDIQKPALAFVNSEIC